MNSEHGILVRRRIKSARVAAKLTQADVAQELGVSRQTVSNWECGGASPNPVELARLCMVFGVSSDQILYGVHTVALSAMTLARIAGPLRRELGRDRPTEDSAFGGLPFS